MNQIRIYVTKAFVLKTDNNDIKSFSVGSHVVDESIANHPFVKAHLGEESINVTDAVTLKKLKEDNAVLKANLKIYHESNLELQKQLEDKENKLNELVKINEFLTDSLSRTKNNGDKKTKN